MDAMLQPHKGPSETVVADLRDHVDGVASTPQGSF